GFAARIDATRYVHALLVAHHYEPIGPPHALSAETARLDRVGGAGWAAVGDAAISFGPLSSQGILTALVSGPPAGEAADLALAGERNAIDEYGHRVDEIDHAYRRHRDACYAAEGRWAGRPFWHRRLGTASTPTG